MYKICQKNILCLSLVLMLSILSTFCHASRYEIYISELTEKERKELCDRNQKLHPMHSGIPFQPCIYNRYKGKTAIGNYMIPPHKNEEAEKILHQFPASDPNTFHYKNFYYGFWTEWDIPQSRRLEGLWDNLLKLVGLGMKP